MIKCKFREKRLSGRDEKLANFKRLYELDKKNKKIIERLDAELNYLKEVNKNWYMMEIERFKNV